MVDTAVAITAGTGTNIDTRTESANGNHRQVIVVGDPSDNTGTAAVNASLGLSVNLTNNLVSIALMSAASLPLPAGAATSANQSTIIGHIDGIETLLGTIDTDTGSISTDAGIIAANTSLIASHLAGTLTVDGSGVTQPISGTITADLGATDNAVLDAIQAAVEGTLSTALVSCASLPLPIGAATSANQSTIISHIDGVESLLTTIDADTGIIATNASLISQKLIDGTLAVNASIPATVAVSNDALTELASAINANKVDVNIASGSSSGTEYTEGDIDATITGTAIMWEDASDTLRAVSASLPLPVSVTGGGDATAANQTTIIGHVDGIEGLLTTIDADTGVIAANASLISQELIDGTLSVAGTVTAELSATDNAVLDTIDAVLDTIKVDTEAIETAVESLQAGQLADGHNVTIDNGSGVAAVNIQDGGNSITVDGTVAVTGVATAANQSTIIGHVDGIEGLLTTIDSDTGNLPTIETNTDYGTVTGGGTETGALRVTITNNSTGVVSIDDNSGSLTVDGTVAATQSGTWNIGTTTTVSTLTGSGVAHDGVDSGNPHKMGGRAQEPTAALEEVADNDRVDAAFDRQGRLATWMGYPVQSAVINTSTSGDNTIVAAAGAGKRIALIGCVIVSDGTTDVRWEDGASGTAKTGQIPLQAREGFVMPIGPQPWFVGSANTLLNLELTAAINVHGIASYVTMED